MKIRIYTICAVVLAIICLLLYLRYNSKPETNSLPQAEVQLTNQSFVSQPVKAIAVQNPTPTQPPPNFAADAVRRGNLEGSNEMKERELAQWQAPIDFYGKVIDENSNALEGVNINFSWYERPAKDGEKTLDTQSDSEGLFSLHGERGQSLTVGFGKEGYYSSHRGQVTFNFALGPNIISPDPLKPVIFTLRKKGTPEPLIHIAGIGLHPMRDYLLAADGKPTDVSLLTGGLMPTGQGDLEVQFQAGSQLDNFPSRITWQCQITVPGGGLIPTSEEFPFLAPQDTYQASDAWSITVTNWTEEVSQQYYVKLQNGNFGRVKLRIIGTSRPYFRMESFVNPSGSRNLEPAP